MEISTFRGYYLHFLKISTFRGYYPHFVDIYVLRGYYPHFVEISMFRRYYPHFVEISTPCGYYPHFVDIIYTDQITIYLAHNVRPIFHIYSFSESDGCVDLRKELSSLACPVVGFHGRAERQQISGCTSFANPCKTWW